jgi:hypothetical protein
MVLLLHSTPSPGLLGVSNVVTLVGFFSIVFSFSMSGFERNRA